MSDTMQSLDQLSQLKPATPEAQKYIKKVDKLGRAYATGKRKDAVARVWIKPGAGKIVVNTREVDPRGSFPRARGREGHRAHGSARSAWPCADGQSARLPRRRTSA